MLMVIKGKARLFGDNVNTDVIIPARYLNTSDPTELAAHCMEDLDPKFIERVEQGDILVAGKNFGCGSSREHAPIALKAAGISCIIAKSFARIFFRNALNIGLPILESSEAVSSIREGDLVEVELDTGSIKDFSSGRTFNAQPFPPFMRDLIAEGGLLAYAAKRGKNKGSGA
jgi:3-isopropylmalate/(R)-2-methylmalate dehydratase small subunit